MNNLNNKEVKPPYDYSNTPAYRRKLKREERKKAEKAGMLYGQGPVTMFLVYMFDFILKLFIRMTEFIFSFTSLGFNSVYDIFYGSYEGALPNSEKFGVIIGMKSFRYFITLLIPPVGVFLSKGLYGWFNVLICFALTYIHIVLGIIYAFVITFRNRYADRYEEMEYKRLMMIKEYVKSCTNEGDKITTGKEAIWMLLSIIFFFICVFALLFYAFKYM
jgi:uncharacterized membrane protein YqaE (UPF0057 family)